MEITKRNGTTEPYDREKIAVAIRKSFASTGQEVSNEIIYSVVEEVENFVGKDTANRSVEQIQDKVEQSLNTAFMPRPKITYSTAGNGLNAEKHSTA